MFILEPMEEHNSTVTEKETDFAWDAVDLYL